MHFKVENMLFFSLKCKIFKHMTWKLVFISVIENHGVNKRTRRQFHLMSETLLGNFVCERTLTYRVTLVNNFLTGVTPVNILHTGVTPVGNFLTGVTPAENFFTGVTPVENFLTGVTPVENFLTGVTPVKNLEVTGTVRQGVIMLE